MNPSPDRTEARGPGYASRTLAAFIVSALALAWIDRMSHHGEKPRESGHGAPVAAAAPAASVSSAASTGYVTVRVPVGAELPAGAEIVEHSGAGHSAADR